MALPLTACVENPADLQDAYPIEVNMHLSGGEFTDLNDVPTDYSTHAGEFVIVNPAEDGLVFTSATSNYTDEMSMDAAAGMIQNGTGITWNYDDGANTLTPTVTASGGADNFTDLDDVPAAYAGHAGEYVIVNGTETGLEFSAGSGGYTDEEAQDAIGAMSANTTTINLTYTDGTPELKADIIAEGAQDIVGAMLAGTETGISVAYNDGTGMIDFTVAAQDHGGLGGLTDDDHTQYLLANGTRTLSGDWTIGEYGIVLDAALSADGKYSGTTEVGTAGAALAFGDIVYLAVADSRWELAKADVSTTSIMKIGICVQAAAGDGSVTTILLWGKVRADGTFPALTVGAPVYISAATAGDITATAPTGTTGFIVRVIGYGNTADELYFCPGTSWVELA
jgi:hypothetical protein